MTCTTCGKPISDVWFYASKTGETSHLTCFPVNDVPADRCRESADGMRCELDAGHVGPHVIDPSTSRVKEGDTA